MEGSDIPAAEADVDVSDDEVAEAVPVVTADLYYPGDPSVSYDVIAQNVDLFDLNTTVHTAHMEAADVHAHSGDDAVPVECYYIPLIAEPVETEPVSFDLTADEAALLMELMDKNSLNEFISPVKSEEQEGDLKIPFPFRGSDSDISAAETRHIVMDTCFESKMYPPDSSAAFDPDSFRAVDCKLSPIHGSRYAIPGAGNRRGLGKSEAKKRKRAEKGQNAVAVKDTPPTAKQIATAKRARTNGQFARCKIKWISVSTLPPVSNYSTFNNTDNNKNNNPEYFSSGRGGSGGCNFPS